MLDKRCCSSREEKQRHRALLLSPICCCQKHTTGSTLENLLVVACLMDLLAHGVEPMDGAYAHLPVRVPTPAMPGAAELRARVSCSMPDSM